MRTLVVITETGSFSKAGDKLGLSQPAISAQVKRLQVMVGGPVFDRVAGGVNLTARGQMVLAHARKLLDANDQILSLGGALQERPHLRLGLSTLFAEEFLPIWKNARFDIPVSFFCDHSSELAKGLSDGYLDIACLINPPPELGELPVTWEENYLWTRSRDLVVSPGAPVPVITWPGNIIDHVLTQALERAGLGYRVAFASPDRGARAAAAANGLGFLGLLERHVAAPLVVAKDYYLPTPNALRVGIAIRDNIKADLARRMTELLRQLAPTETARATA